MGTAFGLRAQAFDPLAPPNPGKAVGQHWAADWAMPDSVDNVWVLPVYSNEDQSIYAIGVRKEVPLHIHKTHTESILVLEGAGLMRLGEDSLTIGPGQLVVIPPNTPHGVRTTSDVPLRVWSFQAPAFSGQDRHWIKP